MVPSENIQSDSTMPPSHSPAVATDALTPRVRRIMDHLAASERVAQGVIIGKIAVGVPLTLIAPVVLSIVLILVFWDSTPSLFVTFILVTLVLVPLLMWLERRTRGGYLSDAIRGEERPSAASSYGEYKMQSAMMASAGITEFALTGPRLLWEAIDALAGKPVIDTAGRAVAAQIVAELLDAGVAIEMQELVRPDRPPPVVMRAVRYLENRDAIGISSGHDRLWLSSTFVSQLNPR